MSQGHTHDIVIYKQLYAPSAFGGDGEVSAVP